MHACWRGRLCGRLRRAHDVPYDELFFGKPWGHFYIDDLAICPFQGDGGPDSLARQTGFYATDVLARASKSGAGPGVALDSGAAGDLLPAPPPVAKATRVAGAAKAAAEVGTGSGSSLPTGFVAGALFGAGLATLVSVVLARAK